MQSWLYSVQGLEFAVLEMSFAPSDESDSELEWASFISKSNHIHCLPALPDRPIVLKPTASLKVLAEQSVELYICIPINLQFYAEAVNNEQLIFEVSSEDRSSTWFGEPDNGVLAYSLYVDLSATLETPQSTSHHIICPVKVTNDSSQPLEVQRLLLQVPYLKIFESESTLWTNEIHIEFKGESEVSDVDYKKRPPSFVKNAKQIADARSSKSSNVISKSFHFFKSLTSY